MIFSKIASRINNSNGTETFSLEIQQFQLWNAKEREPKNAWERERKGERDGKWDQLHCDGKFDIHGYIAYNIIDAIAISIVQRRKIPERSCQNDETAENRIN